MEATCARALEIGLPAIAFTEHADYVRAFAEQRPVDIHGYLESVERCRSKFPGLRILSGVELGEPHRFRPRSRRCSGWRPSTGSSGPCTRSGRRAQRLT